MNYSDTAGTVNMILVIAALALLVGGNFKLFNMANELDELKAAVARTEAVTASAITLIQGIKQKLDDALSSGDPAQLHALSDELGKNADDLAAAVVANTPAAPNP